MCRIRQPWPETITLEYHRIILFVSPLQRRGRSVASALRRRGFAGAAGRDRGGTIMPGMEFKRKMSWYNRARGREWIKTYVNVLRMIYECQDCQDCRWQCCWMRRSKAVPATRNPRQSRSVFLALSFPLLFFLSLFSPRFLFFFFFFFFSSKYVVLDFMLPACRCCFCLCLSFLHNRLISSSLLTAKSSSLLHHRVRQTCPRAASSLFS